MAEHIQVSIRTGWIDELHASRRQRVVRQGAPCRFNLADCDARLPLPINETL